MSPDLSGVHASPNIQDSPDIYEIENLACDREGLIEKAMTSIAPWSGRILVDLGAGTGFHLSRFHLAASHVIGVEPHAQSRLHAMHRVADLGLDHCSVVAGSAEDLPLRDGSVDVIHARFAYFFGPGCEPGIREATRVLRPGGTLIVIDNDWNHGTFAKWLRRSDWVSRTDPELVEQFWSEQGFESVLVNGAWTFDDRSDFEAVIGIEFPPVLAEQIIREHPTLVVPYSFRIYHRTLS